MADQTNILSFSTRVDLSGAKAGMSELKDTISTQMKEAATAATGANEEISTSFASVATSAKETEVALTEAYAQIEAQGLQTFAALNEATTESASVAVEAAAEQTAAVVEGVDIQQAAYSQLALATLENGQAQDRLRQAYTLVNETLGNTATSVEMLAGFEAEAAEASEQLALAKRNLAEVTAYENEVTVVSVDATKAAAAAEREFTAAKEQGAAATGHTTAGIAAASGAIREFEGRLPIRAVERFLVTSLGLGPILQAAFPIIGAVAFGEVIFDIGEKLYKAYETAQHIGQVMTQVWQDSTSSLQQSNDALAVSNDRLEIQIAKLEHKPANGLQLALDEDTASADKLAASLEKDLDRVHKLVEGNQVSLFAKLDGQQGTGDISAKIIGKDGFGGYVQQIRAVKDEFQNLIDAAAGRGDSQQNIVSLKTQEMVALQAVYSKATAELSPIAHDLRQNLDLFQESGGGRGRNTAGALAMVQGYLNEMKEEQKAIGESFRADSDHNTLAPLQANKGESEKAAREHLRQLEIQRDEEKQSGLNRLKDDQEFWTAHIGEFTTGSAQYKTVLDKITHDDEEAATKAHAAIEKYKKAAATSVSDSGAERGIAAMETALLKQGQDITQTGERWRQYHTDIARGDQIEVAAAATIEQATLNAQEGAGMITALGEAKAMAAIHTREYAAELKVLNDELIRLKTEAKIDPVTGANIDPKNAAAQVQIQNQIKSTSGRAGASAIGDDAAINDQIAKPYMKAFDSINSSWLNVQNNLIRSTANIGRQFANMGVDILSSVAQSFEQMVIKAGEMELRRLIIHTATNQASVASDATAAAEANSISALSALKQANHFASVAAIKAWSAFADIPLVGPVLGAVAAAATYTGAMALAAFDTGGIIANTGIALVHKDEAVLPAELTGLLMGAAGRGGSSSSASSSMSQTNNFNGASDAQFKKQMVRNSKTAMVAVQRQVRAMGRA